MEKVTFGKTGLLVARLGFGAGPRLTHCPDGDSI